MSKMKDKLVMANVDNAALETLGLGTVPRKTMERANSAKYKRGKSTVCEIKTPQARTCFSIFVDCIAKKDHVTEKELRELVEKRGAELRTRQPAWRIFQYYRPQLIASKLMVRE